MDTQFGLIKKKFENALNSQQLKSNSIYLNSV